ncbi:putative transposase [Thioalkalivibrio nitratireducens DSM 14787]|uniref:Transposase n=1 Tax=Thioalkalivibrio nitratireducens (strain DSM 14787 / UNIQEM 213 / ALEN2) TaxID=1255043 RepID=L0DY65_THIND|nr:IS4 family transposase [Thioalkalivibrio nitratireducens]AGA34544.1 putative transposase [Thioalkalivibrio nitratireducens DSM 14787]
MWEQSQIKRTLSAPANLARVQALIREAPELHRTGLADRVCATLGFLDARGRVQRAGCLKALRALERAGRITLPPARSTPGRGGQGRRLGEAVPAPQGVGREVTELEGLELVRVDTAEHRALWNELMAREHPRGMGPLVGAQVRYLVGSAQGWLGALGFAASALQLAARDAWIGWDPALRERHRHRVVGLNRFLLRPGVSCRNLASWTLGRAFRRLGADFEACHGYRPWLVETFIEPPHTGVSLRASNWRFVGETCGRGRQDRGHAAEETRKAIYVYELEPDWRARLGVGPAPARGDTPLEPAEGLDAQQWAEHEFGGAPLGDKRLTKRLVDSARRQGEDPLRAFTAVARDDWAAVKGYYRLIDQPEDSDVTPEHILAPHRACTQRRMQAQATVLCLQDGTDLNFTTRPQTRGVGVIGRNQTGAESLGLHLHSTLAVNADGLPLGVLQAQFEAPQPRGDAEPAQEEKKSFRWIAGLRDAAALAATLPNTRVISVADREADAFELYVEQQRHPAVELVIRAQHNRRLADGRRLFDVARATASRGSVELQVDGQSLRTKTSKRPARLGRAARTAELELRYTPVTLRGTPADADQPVTLELTVVHALERDPPKGEKPLEWFVLTTLTVASAEQAAEILRWYRLRWRIEDWHRVLKSGCKIDELGHHSVERLERAIAIRLVIAWRVMLMTLLGREAPELPPELLFSDVELRVLGDYAQSRRRPRPSSLRAAVREVAILGGYTNRNHDPPPGHQLMWHGYAKLTTMSFAYALRDEIG